jgi:DNA helicase IV
LSHPASPTAPEVEPGSDPVAAEQPYVTMLYGRLDARRKETAELLARVLRDETTGTPQAVSERDAAAAMYSEQLATLSAVEEGLCFGRLDVEPDAVLPPGSADAADPDTPGFDQPVAYIGRLGLLDEDHDYEPLLIDWRAPVARPYYTATAANPDGIRRRRHLRTRSRRVLAVDDEILDLAEAAAAAAKHDGSQRQGLTGEATLLAALSSGRTGRMGDIVATIQAEQDRIIRSGVNGVLVVEGGPGTGKTAVALHRAAYLLYTHRRQLAKRGVLVVGPNPTFLRYIEQVLPSLGETSVLLSTVGELYPGLAAQRAEPAEVAARKGTLDMAKVLSAAVRDRQELPRHTVTVRVDGEKVEIDRDVVAQARTRARRTRRPHNDARRTFVREAIDILARRERDRLSREGSHPEVADGDRGLLDRGDLADIRATMRENEDLIAALDALWPILTPPQLLAELYTDPKRITAATRGWSDADRALLRREGMPTATADRGLLDPHWWTPADAVLLDEAAELLGEDDTAERERAERKREADEAYAAGVLEILAMEEDWDPELLRPTDVVDASVLADRSREANFASAAERAAEDRTWTFGHVIVDEAQELSPMAWRVLMRRCPSRSMTLVGDVAQTGARDGAGSWHEVLSPYVAARWRREALTVNYRTPAEIAEVAADVLAVIDPSQTPPESVRESGIPPRAVGVAESGLDHQVSTTTRAAADDVVDAEGNGRVAVLAPAARVDALRERLAADALPVGGTSGGDDAVDARGAADLEVAVVVSTVADAKGLEFDAVVLVDPAGIVEESPRGLNDLYVALTRATRSLDVVHPDRLPTVLGRLAG